jgi:hypothetical protein
MTRDSYKNEVTNLKSFSKCLFHYEGPSEYGYFVKYI